MMSQIEHARVSPPIVRRWKLHGSRVAHIAWQVDGDRSPHFHTACGLYVSWSMGRTAVATEQPMCKTCSNVTSKC